MSARNIVTAVRNDIDAYDAPYTIVQADDRPALARCLVSETDRVAQDAISLSTAIEPFDLIAIMRVYN